MTTTADPARADNEPVLMVLEASVNGTPTHQLLTVRRLPDGAFLARLDELRAIRVTAPAAIAAQEEVDLATLGIAGTYDEARQAIELTVPVERLETFVVGLGGQRRPIDLDAITPLSGLALNYGLYAQTASGSTAVSGNLEALAMTRLGLFASTAAFNSRRSRGDKAVRLDNNWRLIDPKAVRSYLLGDFVSNALAWTNGMRLGGFQIASAFDQRPDIVTAALPEFSGSAALPSTLDLYLNQQRVFLGEVPSGPFDLRALPSITGGRARLVATDVTGRQVEMTKSYYYVSRQLKAGILQYSLDVGAPRLNYGIESFDYDNTVFASGSARYGVNGRLTVEGHVEASADGLIGGGLAIVQSIGGIGAIIGSFAASRYDGLTGAKYTIEASSQFGRLRLFAGTERTVNDYFDLARVSLLRSRRRDALDGVDNSILATARARIVDRAGASFRPGFDPVTISLVYNRIVTAERSQRTGNLSLSRPFSQRLSFHASGYLDLDTTSRYGLFSTLTYRFGGGISSSLGLSRDQGRDGLFLQASQTTGQRQGAVGWGVSLREYEGGGNQRTAFASYRAPMALLRGQVDQSGSLWRGSVQAEGSIVAAGGRPFLANRIGDAFAIVRNAGPNVEVLQGGVRIARTDDAGRALLPNLIPYYEQKITIDPVGLPEGWEPAVTERVAIAGWRQGAIVDFGVRKIQAALVVIRRPDGTPVPAGYTVRLEGGEPAIAGYDGEVYLRGLAATNRIAVDLGRDGTCHADFAYDLAGPAVQEIGPVTCR